VAEQQESFEAEIRRRLAAIEQAVARLARPREGQEAVLQLLGKIANALKVPGYDAAGKYARPW
jgi:hypothetical protein